MLHLPRIKNVPASEKKELHRGSSIEKTPCIAKRVPPPPGLYKSTFPFNDTLHINPGQHPVTESKSFQNVFLSVEPLLKFKLVSYFKSIDSKYRWFVNPFMPRPLRFPVMGCYRGCRMTPKQLIWWAFLPRPALNQTNWPGNQQRSIHI